MKKLINRPEDVVEEMLEGLVVSQPGLARLAGWPVALLAARASTDRRVALISGGGSGHEPAHAGYVAEGMLTAAVAGPVFTSPSSQAVKAAIDAVGGPAGVLLIVKNYTGDRLNFGIAAEEARSQGFEVELVTVADDVALAQSVEHAGRRGIAGTVLVHKVAGAAAQAELDLPAVAAEARAAALAVRSMGVALSPCTLPGASEPSFTLPHDEVELGLGIHGEPGVKRVPAAPCDELVGELIRAIVADLNPTSGDRCVLMVNNLGSTPPMELALAARLAAARLEGHGLILERVYVGTFLTAIDMAGVSLSVMLVDDQRLARLDAPTHAIHWPNAFALPRARSGGRVRAVPNVETEKSPQAMAPPRTPLGKALRALVETGLRTIGTHEHHLDSLDRAIGDGDLGQNLARAARSVSGTLETLPFDEPAAFLRALAKRFQAEIGGTSGPIHAIFLFRMAAHLEKAGQADALDWVNAARAGIEGISNLGGAQVGDRTILDALVPAVDAFGAALGAGQSVPACWASAAKAARQAADHTANLVPRKGRASYLGNRALGHPDPGAVEAALLVEAIAQTHLPASN